MNNGNELENGFLDLKLNQYINIFRNKYRNEYICIEKFNDFFHKIQSELGKKKATKQNVVIMASMAEIQKIYCSGILLFERGLSESANILIRTILELSFKVIEIIRNENFVEELDLCDHFEGLAMLKEIEKNGLFDFSKEEINKYKKRFDKAINKRKKPNVKAYYLAKKNRLEKEYILYRIQCEHSHQSLKVLEDIIKVTDGGIIINGNFRLDEFKESVALEISIVTIGLEVLLKEYINNDLLSKEYNNILDNFVKTFSDVLPS